MLKIMPKYLDKWVAIKNEKVIASDNDYEKLKAKTKKIEAKSKSDIYYSYFSRARC